VGAWAVRPTRAYLRWFHSAARITQTPSKVTAAELRTAGLPQATVWGRVVETTLFTPANRSAERRAALGLEGRVQVLHVGRLAVEKDVGTVVEAFRVLHGKLGDAARFCVAGDGPEGAALRDALPFARHLGFLPRPVLAQVYADADIFVFPSPTETCGLVALEAMASGLPVVGADAGGIRDNVRDGLTGRLVPPGDVEAVVRAVSELAGDPSLRDAMGQAARAFTVACDWERELDLLVAQYEGVCRQPVPTGPWLSQCDPCG
jgi:glycosyltransferase involved in cell wall biosynthesis